MRSGTAKFCRKRSRNHPVAANRFKMPPLLHVLKGVEDIVKNSLNPGCAADKLFGGIAPLELARSDHVGR